MDWPAEHKPPLIPNHFHFIWFGNSLPDFARIAIASALAKNPESTATLWHGAGLQTPQGKDFDRLVLQEIAPHELLTKLGERSDIDADQLLDVYLRLSQPAARANVIRMVVLFLFGGIYLDTDTLTVRDLAPLRQLGAFCGEEPTLWPAGTALLDPRAILLGEVRRACALVPKGYRLHKHMLRYHTMAANNAVLGAAPSHPFLADMLRRTVAMPPAEQLRRYRLGTHLLQDALRAYTPASNHPADEIRVLSSDHFFPLGPEVSRHYLKRYSNPAAVFKELISESTFVIHWYASVSDLISRNEEHIRATAHQNVYSYLCQQHLVGRAVQPVRAPVSSPP